jgi:multicomponent Na+:H+ antiporter subunit B
VTAFIIAALLVLVLFAAVGTVQARNLYAATILLGIYSLLMALTWTAMQALDVAFTEAAVGAGISTVLLFGALIRTGAAENESPKQSLDVPALLAVVATGALMLYGIQDMPGLGDPDAPVHQRAGRFYMSEASMELTHAPNMVTSVLASYRGFDTLFETAVIFTAGAAMILLLRSSPEETQERQDSQKSERKQRRKGKRRKTKSRRKRRRQSKRLIAARAAADVGELEETPGSEERGNIGQSARLLRGSAKPHSLAEAEVLSTVAKAVIPMAIVFGVYVITHGELGPGGGFQGGVIVAAAYILCALVFGLERAQSLISIRLTDKLPAVGVLIYAGVGVTTLLMGGGFLDYNVLNAAHPASGQMIGMTVIELGVGLTVATVMITIFNEVVRE